MPRPTGRFELNRNNQLAKGLAFWLPLMDRNLIDLVGRRRALQGNSAEITRQPERPAYDFNGTFQYIIVQSTPLTAVPLTLSCWFYPKGTGTGSLISVVNSTNATDFFSVDAAMSSAGTPLRARLGNSAGTSSATTNGAVQTQWQMATAVFASNSSRFSYLNGGGKGTSSASRTPSGVDQIGVGALLNSPIVQYFNGNIGDVCLWNRALNDDEVAELYADRWALYKPVWRVFPVSWIGSINYPITPMPAQAAATSLVGTVVKGSVTLTPAVGVGRTAALLSATVKGSVSLTLAPSTATSTTTLGAVVKGSSTRTPNSILARTTTLVGSIVKGSVSKTPSARTAATITLHGTIIAAMPSALVAVASGANEIDLTWTDTAPTGTVYEVERAPDGSSWALISTTAANITSYADTGLTPSTAYFYRVRASNTGGFTAYSNTDTETTTAAAVTTPPPASAKGVTAHGVIVRGAISMTPGQRVARTATTRGAVVVGALALTPSARAARTVTLVGLIRKSSTSNAPTPASARARAFSGGVINSEAGIVTCCVDIGVCRS